MMVRSIEEGLQDYRSRQLNDYLWFGYHVPHAPPSFLFDIDKVVDSSRARTPKGAKDLLSDIVGELCALDGGPYLVPLSGGWDSRILLCELCEHVDRSKVRAVTFGTPGSLDFDLGAGFARSLGIEVEQWNLKDIQVSWAGLVDASRRSQGVLPTLSGPNLQILRDAARNGESVFSGFIGDVINGGHERVFKSGPIADNFRTFAEHGRFASDIELSEAGFFPERKGLSNADMADAIPAQLGMFIWYRVQGFVAPALLGQEMVGWVNRYKNPFGEASCIYTPFTDQRWVSFWVGAKERDLYDQALFFNMVERFYPKAYAFPSKDDWGAGRRRVVMRLLRRGQHVIRNRLHRRLPVLPVRSRLRDNYIDFQWAFRKRDDYASNIERAVEILKERGAVPWLDLDNIWAQHYRGRRDYANALQVLLGLAVSLDADGK